jgi:hypothetical protein
MTPNIGGVLRYDLLAQQHRPTCEHCLRRECVLMFSRGLTEQDIGRALKLDATAVRRLLIEAGQ